MEEKLNKLKEIELPEAVSYAPETIAWYILYVIVFSLILFIIWKRYKKYKKNLYRKFALKELSEIKKTKKYIELQTLVKRIALILNDRKEVASLTGENWWNYLNSTFGENEFNPEMGRILADLSYSEPDRIDKYSQNEIDSLFNLIENWIRKHNA